MAEDADSADNIDRLLKHLKESSLAARLVRAYRDPHANGPVGSMEAVLAGRLQEVRAKFDAPKD